MKELVTCSAGFIWNERIPKEHWGEVNRFFKDYEDEIMRKFGYL